MLKKFFASKIWSLMCDAATEEALCSGKPQSLLSFGNIQGQLDSFKLCNLTQSTLPLSSLGNSSCGAPHSSFPFLVSTYNSAGIISEEGMLAFTLVTCSLFSGAFSEHVTCSSSSEDNPRVSPSGQFVMISRIPGWLRCPIQACCVISTIYLLHETSVAWRVEGAFPFNIQPSTGSQDARSSCALVLITSEADQIPP